MMTAQKSLPPTPALTPAMQHRQNGVTPAMAIQSAMVGNPMMQQGMAVGAGEMPNGAGPFVNGGLHNTSDDSIMMGSSASNRVGETFSHKTEFFLILLTCVMMVKNNKKAGGTK